MPGVRGFEQACSSWAEDEGTTMVECDNWADRPRADGPRADGVRADRPQADGPWADRVQADGPLEDGPWADGPQADGPQEELSPGNQLRADWAMQLQTEEDLDDPPTN